MQASSRIAFLQHEQYVDAGQGTPVLLLHGFCESNLIFEPILPDLFGHCRLICPDMPGHGGRPWNPHWRSLDDAAYWLRDVLDALEITRCVLIGHSLGGYVAAAFAELFPDRLLGLGLLHSTALDDASERRESRTKTIDFVRTFGKEPYLKAFIQGLFHQPTQHWLSTMARITAPTDVEAIVALTGIMRDRPDRSAALKRLRIPVMYIMGEFDGLVSPERSRQELQDLQIAVLVRIHEASHMGMYEAPEKVVAAILSLVEASENQDLPLGH